MLLQVLRKKLQRRAPSYSSQALANSVHALTYMRLGKDADYDVVRRRPFSAIMILVSILSGQPWALQELLDPKEWPGGDC